MAKKKTTKAASKTTKTKATKKTSAKKKLNNLNETGARKGNDRRVSEVASDDAPERRKKRRRQIDPTTCEREYKNCEIEFMHALDEYKRASGRMFPTCSEILEVIVGLGYRKVAEATEGFAFEKDNDSGSESVDEFGAETLEAELEDQLI